MVIFHRLEIKNFMSYEEAKVPLHKQGIVQIQGVNNDDPLVATSNMAGKSAIMEALLWVLFGKTLRGLKHEEVVNRKLQKNCMVSVVFSAEGVTYTATRYRKHHKFGNHLRLYCGEKLLHFRHEANTQKKLESILDCDFQAFVSSTVFGGFDGARKQFALLTDSEQKRVLDSFLRFEKFELALKRSERLFKETSIQHMDLRLIVERQSEKVSSLKEKIATLKDSQKIFRARDREERRQVKKQLNALKKPSYSITEDSVDEKEDEFEALTQRLAAARNQRTTLVETYDQLRSATKLRRSMLGSPCPFCGAPITEKTLKNCEFHFYEDRISLKKKLNKASSQIESLEREVTYGRKRLKRQQNILHKEKDLATVYRVKKQELLARLDLHERATPFNIQIEEAQLDYRKQLSRLLVYRQEEMSLQSKLDDLKFWQQGFSNRGVKTLVVREVLPTMNRKLKEYAKEIFPSGVHLEFRADKQTKKGTERELFHLHYSSKLNSKSYVGESSGGRRRVDICVLLVFCWLARSCNLLLCDELLDSLDDAGREKILAILARQRGTILVISHDRDLKRSLKKVWTVHKRNGVSTLEIPS